jgi:CHAT domain-containing protein
LPEAPVIPKSVIDFSPGSFEDRSLMGKGRVFRGASWAVFVAGAILFWSASCRGPAANPVKAGRAALEAGDFDKALAFLSDVLKSPSSDEKTMLSCRIHLGLANLNLDKPEDARTQFAAAAELAKKLGAGEDERFCRTALSIHELYLKGRESYKKRDLAKSVEYYRKAADLARSIGSPAHELKILKAWGLAAISPPGNREYLDLNQRGLALARSIRHRSEIAGMLSAIGGYYSMRGEHSDALVYFLQSAAEARKPPRLNWLATALSNLSGLYLALGDHQKAFDAVSEALTLGRTPGFSKITPDLLMNLGTALSLKALQSGDSDDTAKAVRSFMNALDLARKSGDGGAILRASCELADAYVRSGQGEKAEPLLDSCIGMASSPADRLVLAQLWGSRGALELARGEVDKAEAAFGRASELARLADSEAGRLYFLAGLARCREKRGRPEEALDLYAEAVRLISQVGSHLKSDIGRAGFVRNKTDVYQGYADLCYRLYLEKKDERYGRELFAVMERAKARSFVEFLGRRQATAVLPDPSPEDVRTRLLDARTALVEYFLGEAASYVMAITPSAFRVAKLPPRRDIEDSLAGFLRFCERPSGDLSLGERAAARLYRELLEPALDRLPDALEHVLIVPDGLLFRLPFEALIAAYEKTGPNKYLIEQYSMSYAPSATALMMTLGRPRVRAYEKDLLAIGAPDYPDRFQPPAVPSMASDIVLQALADGGYSVAPLPYSRAEVNGIAGLFAPGRRTVRLGKAADKTILKSTEAGVFRVIHIACHAISDDIDPFRSAILFSLDKSARESGILTLEEMYDLRMAAELVVLSACQTGHGRIITNEGVLGLPRVFFYAGAASVVSSLWSIEDKATASFMTSFYRGLLAGQSKAEALRAAKADFIRSKYGHPYYWAAFVLTGDYSSSIR